MSKKDEAKLDNRLKAQLAECKMTQVELSKEMGVLPQQVSNWVGGRATPTLPMAFKIAKRLNTTVDAIWRLDEMEGGGQDGR